MSELVNKIKCTLKKPKTLVIIGAAGVLFIALSAFLPAKSTDSQTAAVSAEEYRTAVTAGVEKIVTGITGDKNPTVLVTLESGPRYTYADSRENDNATSSGDKNSQSSEKSRRSYVTVRESDGSERALIITESMPQIRGVAVICEGGGNDYTAEEIKNAVTAALDITSKRVYVSGGTEK